MAVFVWIYGSEAPRLFGFVVVRRTANISMCGGIWIYGGIWVRCVVVFVRCTRYVVVINGRSVVPRKIAKFGYWRFCSFSGGGDFLNHHTSTLPPHIQNRDSRTTTNRQFSQATTTDPHQKPRCHISKSTQQRKPPHIQANQQDSKTTTHRQFSLSKTIQLGKELFKSKKSFRRQGCCL